MPDEPLIDLAALTAPVPGPDPSGGSTPYDLKQKIDDARKEVSAADYDAKDPTRPADKPSDWPLVVKLTTDGLKTKAKDLLVAAQLTEALTKLHGFTGLRDGLRLLKTLLTDCWDRLAPKLESDDDLDIRGTPFSWLSDPNYGARFPVTIRAVPVVAAGKQAMSFADWQRGQAPNGAEVAAAFTALQSATPPAKFAADRAALEAAQADLAAITDELSKRLKQYAPSLAALRDSIDDCAGLVARLGPTEPPPPTSTTDGTPATAAPGVPAALGASRADLYKQLDAIAQKLGELEPHSPIPYLIGRCVKLGRMPFPQMIRELVRDDSVLKEMTRELQLPTAET